MSNKYVIESALKKQYRELRKEYNRVVRYVEKTAMTDKRREKVEDSRDDLQQALNYLGIAIEKVKSVRGMNK